MTAPDSDIFPAEQPNDAPTASEILKEVAAKLELTPEQVEQTLAEANITLRSPTAADRRLRVLRLRASGVKHSGESFAVEQEFTSGVWAIVHPHNSVGKTSLLEFLVWPLRGEPRDLPPDVRSWLRHLSLDIAVAGRPIRLVLNSEDSQHTRWRLRILTGSSTDELLVAEDTALRLLASASGNDEISRCLGAFFLDALRMEHTNLWQAAGGADGDGAPQVHGWASYFGACYLNPGGDEILIGDVSAVGLSARLMELFVDIPYSTALTQLSVAGKREKKTTVQEQRRAEGDAKARLHDRENWQNELTAVSGQIEMLHTASTQEISPSMRAADQAATDLRGKRALREEAEQTLAEVTVARVRAGQALLDARETWQARRVLGRLDPVCCPRCEEPLDGPRRSQERAHASCAVCTRPLPEVDAETAEIRLAELEHALAAALQAEQEADQQHATAAEAVAVALITHQGAAAELEQLLATSQAHNRLRTLEIRAAELRGRLKATGSTSATPPVSLSAQVLAATEEAVRAAVDRAATQLFPAMNHQIVELATRFGVQNLDSVKLNRAGQVNAVKAGVRTPFKKLSRGDRLRMRIATVIALLRVGADRGATTHPGLLLIDSVAAEEVTAVPARTLIAELQAVAAELPDLQVILTTAQPELVAALSEKYHITSGGEHLF